MKRILHLLILTLSIFSCSTERDYQKIDFTNSYKFEDEILDQLNKDDRFGKHQYAAWDFAFQGDYENALKQWDLAKPPNISQFSTKQVDSISQNYKLINAREYLKEIVGNYQIVIINEAHQNSFHRHFTASLLRIFYNNGFRYFGLEDLKNGKEKDSLLNKIPDSKFRILYQGPSIWFDGKESIGTWF